MSLIANDDLLLSDLPPRTASWTVLRLFCATFSYVSFKGVVPDPARDPDILAQARRVGACRVVLSSNRHGSREVGYGPEDRSVAVYEVSAIFFAKPK